ncbi:hypothetical protein ANCCAN_14564 [Ancylostoma caninum]|uniref:Uncharacterized protein n=1 Tax=Ancylostoma caninum TaxID=29170 RepID=A0A368G4Z0_ANCCA|nr:hypothetical protein ANCCAN_14564 [Ancylostoma caninum]
MSLSKAPTHGSDGDDDATSSECSCMENDSLSEEQRWATSRRMNLVLLESVKRLEQCCHTIKELLDENSGFTGLWYKSFGNMVAEALRDMPPHLTTRKMTEISMILFPPFDDDSYECSEMNSD